jgi:hypothetical protein
MMMMMMVCVCVGGGLVNNHFIPDYECDQQYPPPRIGGGGKQHSHGVAVCVQSWRGLALSTGCAGFTAAWCRARTTAFPSMLLLK